MRFALISDIHANLPALHAVLSHIGAQPGVTATCHLGDEGIHFVNTGSVGRPKDGNWRTGYVLLDVDETGARVEFVRVEYDLDAAMGGIRESDLPYDFADHLRTGGPIPKGEA